MALRKLAASIKANCDVKSNGGTLVVPVVMIVEGVLNDALLTVQEFGKYVGGWNGRPVVVRHPADESGNDISAAESPETMATYAIGTLYNARIENSRLIADMHIDEKKACSLGFCGIVEALKAGKVLEVSTGYFSDAEPSPGDHNGESYSEIHRNIVPDHLAILPDQEGACSVDDGCGTCRTNRKQPKGKVTTMDKKELLKKLAANAEKLRKNEKLTAEQFDAIMEMDEEQLEVAAVLIEAAVEGAVSEETIEDPTIAEDDDEEKEVLTQEKVDEMVANASKRARLTERLTSNKACVFGESDLKTMSIPQLEKLDQQLASVVTHNDDVDYSGMGGFSKHSATSGVVANSALVPKGIVKRG